jgi:small-conductance mechanosensitive channel
LNFGSSSLDVEVFAYILAVDFPDFLAVQEELLLRFMDAIQAAGTRMALPSQTTYVASGYEGIRSATDFDPKPAMAPGAVRLEPESLKRS